MSWRRVRQGRRVDLGFCRGGGSPSALGHIVDHALAEAADSLTELCNGAAPIEAMGEILPKSST